MMRALRLHATFFLLAACVILPPLAAKGVADRMRIEVAAAAPVVRFSPNGGATALVVSAIGSARSEVRVMAYSFTSKPIAEALKAAHARGVDVAIVLDKSQPTAHGSMLDTCQAAGIPVWIDRRHPIMHNKVCIVDGRTITTGSMNMTAAGERSNAENCLLLHDPDLARLYRDNWTLHAGHSEQAK